MVKVGFIGLGTMGGPIAKHIHHADNELCVFDIDEKAMEPFVENSAKPADSPEEVGKNADIVFLSLPRPEHVEGAITAKDGLINSMKDGDVVVDLSTSLPGITERINEKLSEQGIDMLGAPVSKGEVAAKEGTLSVMVGGPNHVFNEHRHLFELFAEEVNHVSEEPGHGHAVKLLNNYLSFTAVVATSEAAALGRKVGLDLETMIKIFDSGTGRNSATEVKFPDHVIPGTYDRGFTLELTEKDMQLFTDFSEEYDAPLFAGAAISQIITGSKSEYGKDGDITQIYQYVCSLMGSEE